MGPLNSDRKKRVNSRIDYEIYVMRSNKSRSIPKLALSEQRKVKIIRVWGSIGTGAGGGNVQGADGRLLGRKRYVNMKRNILNGEPFAGRYRKARYCGAPERPLEKGSSHHPRERYAQRIV